MLWGLGAGLRWLTLHPKGRRCARAGVLEVRGEDARRFRRQEPIHKY